MFSFIGVISEYKYFSRDSLFLNSKQYNTDVFQILNFNNN